MSHFAMPVSLYMSEDVVSVPESAPIAEVYRLLGQRGISCVPVVDGTGRPVGVLSRTDLLRLGRLETRSSRRGALLSLPDKTAREVMHTGTFTVGPDTLVSQAAHVMVKRRVHRLFVHKEDVLVGVFSTKDLLVPLCEKRVATPIRQHMASPAFTIPARAPIAVATDRLAAAHVSGLVVVDEDDWPVGTFTQTEALLARDLDSAAPVEDAMSAAMLCLDVRTPLHRAAAQAHATRARRVLAVEGKKVQGVITGLDFARAAG